MDPGSDVDTESSAGEIDPEFLASVSSSAFVTLCYLAESPLPSQLNLGDKGKAKAKAKGKVSYGMDENGLS
jgi:hypothetical protein